MPDTFQEDTFKGHDVCKIYLGEFRGEEKFLTLGVKKAKAILENLDRLRQWVDKHE